MVPQRVVGRALPFLAVALSALLLGGCVRIITQQKSLDTPLGMKDGEPVPIEPELKVSHEFTGNQLVVSVMEQPRCRIEKFQVVDRTEVIERQAESWTLILSEFVLGALMIGLGASSVATADEACAEGDDSPEGETLTPGKCKAFGYSLIGIGGISLGAGVWNTFRTRDSSKHVGRVEIPQGKSVTNCGSPGPASGKLVKLNLGGNLFLENTTDSSGHAAFSFPAGRPLPIEASPEAATVHVGSLAPITVNASLIVPETILAAREEARRERERAQAQKAEEEARRAELRQAASCRSLCAKFKACTSLGMDRGTCWSMEIAKPASELGLSDITFSWQGLGANCDASCQQLETQLKTDGSVCLDRDPRCVRGLLLMRKSAAIIGGLSGQSPATQMQSLREADRLLAEAQRLVCEAALSSPPCLKIPQTRQQIQAAIRQLEQRR